MGMVLAWSEHLAGLTLPTGIRQPWKTLNPELKINDGKIAPMKGEHQRPCRFEKFSARPTESFPSQGCLKELHFGAATAWVIGKTHSEEPGCLVREGYNVWVGTTHKARTAGRWLT